MKEDIQIEKAKEFYFSIKQVACPALNNEVVVFNMLGFNHLVRKGRLPRLYADKMQRLRLLKVAKDIIKNATKVSEYRSDLRDVTIVQYGRRVKKISKASFWSFEKKHNNKMVTVLVRQIGNGQKHFFSVMSKKHK